MPFYNYYIFRFFNIVDFGPIFNFPDFFLIFIFFLISTFQSFNFCRFFIFYIIFNSVQFSIFQLICIFQSISSLQFMSIFQFMSIVQLMSIFKIILAFQFCRFFNYFTTFNLVQFSINVHFSILSRVVDCFLLTSQQYFSNQFVSSNSVKIHDLYVDGTIPDLLPGHVKFKGGVEDGVQVAFVNRSLFLFHSFVAKH